VIAAVIAASVAAGPWARAARMALRIAIARPAVPRRSVSAAGPVAAGAVVAGVVGGGTDEQVRGVLAGRLVAAVADDHIGADQPLDAEAVSVLVGEHVGGDHPGGAGGAGSDPEPAVPVAAHRADPEPACGRCPAVHLRGEPAGGGLRG
jgi:hypothetical protein